MKTCLARPTFKKTEGEANSGARARIAVAVLLGAALLFPVWPRAFAGEPAVTREALDEPLPQVAPQDEPADPAVDTRPRSLFRSQKDASSFQTETEELRSLPGTNVAVSSGDLEDVGMDMFGVLEPGEGGFGHTMWSGSSAPAMRTLLATLARPGASPARQELYTRLFQSRAWDPARRQDVSPGAVVPVPFLTLRAKKLYQAGLLREAEVLLDQSIKPAADLATLKLRANIFLLTQRPRQACALAARTRGVGDDTDWSRLRTLCYILARDTARARLGADLLAEQGFDDPLFFTAVANRVDDAGLEYGKRAVRDAVHFSLLTEGLEEGQDGELGGVPKAVLNTKSVALSAAAFFLAGTKGRGEEDLVGLEIPLARRGVRSGSLFAERLSILYSAVSLSDDERAALIAAPHQTTKKEAALHQSIKQAVMPAERAALLAQALEEMQPEDSRSLFMALYRDAVLALPVDPALEAYAASFAWVALGAGDWFAAAKWIHIKRAAAAREFQGDDPSQNKDGPYLASLSAALQIVAPQAATLEPQLDILQRLVEAGDVSGSKFRRAVLEARLYEAFGGALSPDVRKALASAPVPPASAMPAPGVLARLDAAARAGRKGEVILLTLSALGDSKPAQIPSIVIAKCVFGLVRTGFITEAKTLAIESLLADLPAMDPVPE